MSFSSERVTVISKGETTRLRILDRALELAGRDGLAGLSIGGLAEDLGLSKSGLFAHFKSKERLQLDVLDAAVEHFKACVFDPMLRKARGEPRLIALFENWLKWIHSQSLPGACVLMAGTFASSDRSEPLHERVLEWSEKLHQALARSAQITVEQAQFRQDLDVDQFAHELHGILIKYHFEARLKRNRKALVRTRRAFQRLLADARA